MDEAGAVGVINKWSHTCHIVLFLGQVLDRTLTHKAPDLAKILVLPLEAVLGFSSSP